MSTTRSPSAEGTLVAGIGALVGLALLIHGLELSIVWMDIPADNAALGGWMLLGGLASVLGGLIWSPRLARSSQPWLRTVLGLTATFAASAFCFAIPLVGANVKLFLVLCAVIAVLVPPRRPEWFAGAAIGCLVAGALHTAPWAGLTLGLLALVVAIAVGEHRVEASSRVARYAGSPRSG